LARKEHSRFANKYLLEAAKCQPLIRKSSQRQSRSSKLALSNPGGSLISIPPFARVQLAEELEERRTLLHRGDGVYAEETLSRQVHGIDQLLTNGAELLQGSMA
jgi:hypothetical protein